MSWLLDTIVLSELRKGERGAPGVRRWLVDHADDLHFTSVLVLGELRRGVELKRRRDPEAAAHLDAWVTRLELDFRPRILPINAAVAERWGHLNVPDPVPAVDGLIAATALVHDLVVVTRNVKDIARTGARVHDPFEG